MTIYLQAFYFAMGTIVAYTDTVKEGPREPFFSDRDSIAEWRTEEQWVVIAMLFIGACAWAYITARFVDMVSNGDPATHEFYQKVDLLNRFCLHFRIDSRKRRRLREYMHEMREELRDADECDQVFDLLSPHLLQDILWDVHGRWLIKMPFLRNRMRSVVSNPTVGDANRDARSSPQGAAVQLGTSVQPSVAQTLASIRLAAAWPCSDGRCCAWHCSPPARRPKPRPTRKSARSASPTWKLLIS